MSEIELTKVRKRHTWDVHWKDEDDHSKGLRDVFFNRKFNKTTKEIEVSLGLTKRKQTRWNDHIDCTLPENIRSSFRDNELAAYEFSGGKDEYNRGSVVRSWL